MELSIIIGLGLAKNVFQAHGARTDGSGAFRVKLARAGSYSSSPSNLRALSRWKPAQAPITGLGPICASAMMAWAPPAESFARSRDFSTWLGLVPKQHSSGGKERLGRISKMGRQPRT